MLLSFLGVIRTPLISLKEDHFPLCGGMTDFHAGCAGPWALYTLPPSEHAQR